MSTANAKTETEDVTVLLSNIDIASNIQVFLIENNISKDGPTSDLWKDVLKLSKYIHQQTAVALQAVEAQKKKVAAISSSSSSSSRHQEIKQPLFPERKPSDFRSPASKTTESSRSGFDRFLTKALSPPSKSTARAEERSLMSALNNTNNSMTFDLSRPPSPIVSLGVNSSHVVTESSESFPLKISKPKASNRKLIDSVDANVMDILSSISDVFQPVATTSERTASSIKKKRDITDTGSTSVTASVSASNIDKNSLSLLKSKKKLPAKNRDCSSFSSSSSSSSTDRTFQAMSVAAPRDHLLDNKSCTAGEAKTPLTGSAAADSTSAAAPINNNETPATLVAKHTTVDAATIQAAFTASATPHINRIFRDCDTPTIDAPSETKRDDEKAPPRTFTLTAVVEASKVADNCSLQRPTCSSVALFSTPPRKVKSLQQQHKRSDSKQAIQNSDSRKLSLQMSSCKSVLSSPRAAGEPAAASPLYSTPQVSHRGSGGRPITSASRTTTSASCVKSHRTTSASKTPPNKMNLRQSWKLAIPRSSGGKTLAKQFEEAGVI